TRYDAVFIIRIAALKGQIDPRCIPHLLDVLIEESDASRLAYDILVSIANEDPSIARMFESIAIRMAFLEVTGDYLQGDEYIYHVNCAMEEHRMEREM
ncbi:MAG: hypothetical protein ABII39_02395, partial [Candidatus Micrarchaeota archaeon]